MKPLKYGHPNADSVNVKATEGKCILILRSRFRRSHNRRSRPKAPALTVYTFTVKCRPHMAIRNCVTKHLVGNYGSGWQNQQVEFARFPPNRDDF
ncbi:hypothetical protein KCP73_02750 [Salmonella enterica subsp. enterica]|nr:hypothetical protein KCP73_02750 [Salmonella enterica subsp. enterica]